MGRKRNQTEEEKDIHRKATALRKLTDEQLVQRIEEANKPAELKENPVELFISAFENAGIPNIGKVTIKKLRTFAEESGFTGG